MSIYEKINPPKNTSSSILKKAGQPTRVEDIKGYLESINWKLRHMGCDHYQFMNHRGKGTAIEVRDYGEDDVHFEIRDKGIFGSDRYAGSIYAYLKTCTIEKCEGTLYIYDRKGGGISIHLNNFDKPYTDQEKFEKRQPRRYQIHTKCSECGTVVMKSRRMSAFSIWKDWTILVMSGPLNARACPKCKYSTFSDCNMGIKEVIYNLKTKRPVKFDHIKKIAEPLKREYYELDNN